MKKLDIKYYCRYCNSENVHVFKSNNCNDEICLYAECRNEDCEKLDILARKTGEGFTDWEEIEFQEAEQNFPDLKAEKNEDSAKDIIHEMKKVRENDED